MRKLLTRLKALGVDGEDVVVDDILAGNIFRAEEACPARGGAAQVGFSDESFISVRKIFRERQI